MITTQFQPLPFVDQTPDAAPLKIIDETPDAAPRSLEQINAITNTWISSDSLSIAREISKAQIANILDSESPSDLTLQEALQNVLKNLNSLKDYQGRGYGRAILKAQQDRDCTEKEHLKLFNDAFDSVEEAIPFIPDRSIRLRLHGNWALNKRIEIVTDILNEMSFPVIKTVSPSPTLESLPKISSQTALDNLDIKRMESLELIKTAPFVVIENSL